MNRSDYPPCTIDGDSIILSLHINPRASKNEVCGVQNGVLKIRLTSPPVDGAANKLCREFLAGIFGVPKSAVELIAGETSRHKRVRISDSDARRLEQIVETFASTGNVTN